MKIVSKGANKVGQLNLEPNSLVIFLLLWATRNNEPDSKFFPYVVNLLRLLDLFARWGAENASFHV